jgi:outer membrane PBP1 activator LpoA protein
MAEDDMADPAAYTWHAAYQTAVLGTGAGSLGSRIAAAFTSIQERLNSSPAVGDAEHREIEEALLVLHALRAEIAP